MTVKKIPIESGKGAGVLSHGLGRVELALLAIVAHSLDVLSAGDVGLRGHHSAVTILRHPEGIRQLNPFHCIDVNGEIPFMHFLRADSKEERIEARDHEALNVVSVAPAESLLDDFAQTSHGSLPRPIELRELLLSLQLVAVPVFGHEVPVNAPNVFPPAEDLADEAFGGRNGNPPRSIGLFGFFHGPARIKQLEVESGGNSRVKEEGFSRPHGILDISERFEAVLNKIVESTTRFSFRNRPGKVFERTGVIAKSFLDEGKHLAGDVVLTGLIGLGHVGWSLFAERFPILLIEIPTSLKGIPVLGHQDRLFLPQLPVKILHPELLPPLRPLFEVLWRRQKVMIGQDLEVYA